MEPRSKLKPTSLISRLVSPTGGVTFDSAGNLYGVTDNGGNSPNCGGVGSGCGSIFELSPAGGTAWTQTTIYTFQDHADGALPLAGLTFDSAGNLYGTNFGSYTEGGTSHGGVAFELSHASGNSWTFTPLYTFDQTKETVPPSSPLTIDAAGNLYGVTYFGGRYSNGSVFELSKTGKVWKGDNSAQLWRDQATARCPTGHWSSTPKATLRHNFRRRIRGLGNCLRIVPPNLWSVEGKPALHFRERSQPPGWIDS